MALTAYPVALDNYVTTWLDSTDSLVAHHGSVLHNQLPAAINALESLLGVNATQTSPGGANRVLNSTSAAASTWTATPTVTSLTATSVAVASATAAIAATFSNTDTITANNNTIMQLAASGNGGFQLNVKRRFTGGGSGDFVLNHSNGGDAVGLMNNGGVTFPNVGTTASAANAFLDNAASNNLLRSTSSLRYKVVLDRLSLAEARAAVLGLAPIIYLSKAAADDPRREFIGFGAEDVAKLDTRFVTYDQLGRPDWVQYQLLVAPMALLLQDHENRLKKLGG